MNEENQDMQSLNEENSLSLGEMILKRDLLSSYTPRHKLAKFIHLHFMNDALITMTTK